MAPDFDKISKEDWGEKTHFYVVDIDKHKSYAKTMGVRVVPTLVIIKDKVEVGRKTGYMNDNAIRRFINEKR